MKVKSVVDSEGKRIGLSFKCPGCGDRHTVYTAGRVTWDYNGDDDKPTVKPSILVRSGHYTYDNPQEAIAKGCYCNFHERYPDQPPMPWSCYRCHSFVTDGKIEFLPDCTHELAGQTVDLPDIE